MISSPCHCPVAGAAEQVVALKRPRLGTCATACKLFVAHGTLHFNNRWPVLCVFLQSEKSSRRVSCLIASTLTAENRF